MAGGRSLPVYLTGTVAVANVAGTWTVSGSGTNFIAPDGIANYTLLAGDLFVIPNTGFGTVGNVAGAASLTLDFWIGGAVTAGASYKIYRYEGLPSSAIVALTNQLLTSFSDTNPLASATIDTGAVRLKIDDDGAGNFRFRVRASGASDSTYVTALTINGTTGAVALAGKPAPQSLTVTGVDTIAALATSWSSAWSPMIVLNNLCYFPPSFTVTGTAVAWSATNAGTSAAPVHIQPGDTALLIAL